MSAERLLAELRAQGIGMMADGEHLHIEAASGALTPDLVERVRSQKVALLALLEGELGEDPVYRWIRANRPDARIAPRCPACSMPRLDPNQRCGVCSRLGH